MNFLKQQNQCYCLWYRQTTPHDFLKLLLGCNFKRDDMLLITIDSDSGAAHEFSELLASIQALKQDKNVRVVVSITHCVGQVYTLALCADTVYTTSLTRIGKFDTAQNPYTDLLQTTIESLTVYTKMGPKFTQQSGGVVPDFIDIIKKYRPIAGMQACATLITGEQSVQLGLVDELKDIYTIRKGISETHILVNVEQESKIDIMGLATKYLTLRAKN